MLERLTEHCIARPLTAWVIMIAMSLVGGLAVAGIGISQYPDVDRLEISVSAELPGAPPDAMERDVCEPIEEALAQSEGIVGLDSAVRAGRATVMVRLQPGRDVDDALQDAQNRLARITNKLPRDLLPVRLSKTNPEDRPLVILALSGPFSRQQLSDAARYLVSDAMQTVPGVGAIDLFGPQTRAVQVWLDRERLEAFDLTVADVVGGLERNNRDVSGGTVESAGGDLGVRITGQPGAVADLAGVVIAAPAGADGAVAPIRLGEVGVIEDGFLETRRINRVDGQARQGIGISKQRGANAVSVAAGIRTTVARLTPTLPSGMRLEVSYDNSDFIVSSISAMWHELAVAVVLTALVCWIFLGALWAAGSVLLAIPMALLGTVAALWGWGATLNTFTLLGLALAIGLVVDDAIMVQESIDRMRSQGLDPRESARRGTARVRFAALAASIAVLAVFAPVMFMRGEVGASFLQFGLALCVAVGLSYVEAVTLAPARAAMADLDVSVEELAATVGGLVGGTGAGTFTLDGRRQDVRVRLRADQRATPDDLGRLRLRTRSGGTVPLASVARLGVRPTPASLTRLDREPAVKISANAAPGVSQEQAQAIALGLVGELPAGYRAVPGDSAQAFRASLRDLGFALIAGIVAAYLVLVVQFNSLVHPLTVLTVLPLAAAGAGIALLAGGQTLNLYSGIGMLLLMGLAKKNSILLVDRANQAREAGEAADARLAMRLAGPDRLRAILMTSTATCAAALPIVLGLGDGTEVRRPMALAILGGIAISTLLSLVAVPAFYVLVDRFRR